MSTEWYYHDGTRLHGPLSAYQLVGLAARGVLRPDHRVRQGADGKWHLASQLKGLKFASSVRPSPATPASPPPLPAHADRDAFAARPIVVAEPSTAKHPITLIQAIVVHRAQNLGFVRQATGHLQRLVRPPLRSYSIAAACGLAVVLVVTVAMMLGHSSRPKDQNSQPQVTTANQADTAFHQGETAYEKQDYDLAISCFTEAIRLRPDDASSYCKRGSAYGSKGNQDRAIADFTEAIRLKRDYVDAYNGRGQCYFANSDYARAIADCTESIRINPSNAEMHVHRGDCYGSQGDMDQAIINYNAAISLEPNCTQAYVERGLAFNVKRDFVRALADFSKATQLDRTSAAAQNGLGNAHFGLAQYDLAVADYAEAIRLDPRVAVYYCNRAGAYGKRGNLELAVKDFDAALQLNPNDSSIIERKNQALQELRKTVAAESPKQASDTAPVRDPELRTHVPYPISLVPGRTSLIGCLKVRELCHAAIMRSHMEDVKTRLNTDPYTRYVFAEYFAKFGINPFTDIESFYVAIRLEEPSFVVAIAEGQFNVERVDEAFEGDGKEPVKTYGSGIHAYRTTEPGTSKPAPAVFAFVDNQTFVYASTLGVLDGVAKAYLAKSEAKLDPKLASAINSIRGGHTLWVASLPPTYDREPNGPNSELPKAMYHTDWVAAGVSVADDVPFTVRMNARSVEHLQTLHEMVSSGVKWAQQLGFDKLRWALTGNNPRGGMFLPDPNDPEIIDMMTHLRVEKQDTCVSVDGAWRPQIR